MAYRKIRTIILNGLLCTLDYLYINVRVPVKVLTLGNNSVAN